MPLISIVSPCYNEQENIEDIYQQVKDVFAGLPNYCYEHIFIDNASKDKTVEILKGIAKEDKNVKIIVNSRNFGYIKSPYYGLLQGKGDAVISLVSDLQEPPELIKAFIKKWEEGYKIVLGVKSQSKESALMFSIRKMYYNLLSELSEIELTKNCSGFGLYDKKIIETLKNINDPYPFLRGLIAEVGFESAKIEFTQHARERGKTKGNFYSLYDAAMLGITNHSKIPLRLAALIGFSSSIISLIIALIYFVYKIIFWKSFSVGIAPLVIGFFFFSSVQLFFLGIVGEYIGAIYTQVKNRPLVIEKERVNFD